VVGRVSCDPNYVPTVIEIDQSADRVIGDLAVFSRRGDFQTLLIRGGGQTAPYLGRTELRHRGTKYDTLVSMRSFISKWLEGRSKKSG